jgi:mRNA interferase RelE/StbE
VYQLYSTRAAIEALRRIPSPYRERIRARLEEVAVDPEGCSGEWKPLNGTSLMRLRVGTCRAICEVRSGELVLLVIKIGSRGDVYK